MMLDIVHSDSRVVQIYFLEAVWNIVVSDSVEQQSLTEAVLYGPGPIAQTAGYNLKPDGARLF